MSNHRPRLAWVIASASVAMAVSMAMQGCSSKSSGGAVAAQCVLNSDCTNPLVCTLGVCHEACTASLACPSGELCVEISGNGVCELPDEASCSSTQPCAGGLVCGTDSTCRTPCMTVSNCIYGQLCEGMVCYDPGEIDAGGSSSDSGEAG